MSDILNYAKEVLQIELTEASKLPARLDEQFEKACQLILDATGKVIVSGIGKSGHIGSKIAASLASTGSPAFFMHATEALHGDFGMINPNDVVIFISYSGRGREFDVLLPLLKEHNIPVIAMTGNKNSPLAQSASCVIDIHVDQEASPIGLVPTSSTVNTLMMGDALAVTLMWIRGFTMDDFARSHPGGSLGANLLSRVHHVMRTGERLPKLLETDSVFAAMLELSRTGLGLVPIVDDQHHVLGVFTDGDLRRLLINKGSLDDTLTKVMTKPGFQLFESLRSKEALELLHKHNINAAPVVNADRVLVGIINIHDLHQAGIG